MTPSNRWFPSSLQDRAGWCANFSIQFTDKAVALGFTAGDATANAADCKLVVDLALILTQVDVYAEAVRKYRDLVLDGEDGNLTPAFPDLPGYTDPSGPEAGVFDRIDKLVKRIRVSPAYTPEIGALMGILPQSVTRPPDNEMQPELKSETLPGSVIEVKFKRGSTDGIVIETKVGDSETWTEAGKFAVSPAELVIPSVGPNTSSFVQIRARYLDGNSPIGQYSPAISTVTQPAG